MKFHHLTSLLALVAVSCLPLAVQAEETKADESFQSICVNSWMKRANEAKDQVDYKDFGEKYCGCAAAQPLENNAAIDAAIQLCMSRTLLVDAMDSVEEEIGLDKVVADDVSKACLDRWSLVYPNMTEQGKVASKAYCDCANPKLMDLVKASDNMTDKDYADQINAVAATCSSEIKPDAEPAAVPAPAAPATTSAPAN